MFNSRWAKDFGWGLVISTHHNCNGSSGFNIPTTRDRGDWICLQQPTTNVFFNGFIPYKIVKYESLGIGQSIEYCLYHAVSSFVGTLMVFVSPHLFAGNQTHHPMFHGVSPESPSSTGDLPENYQFATPRRVRLADSSSTCAACGCVFCATVTMWWFPKTDRIYIYIYQSSCLASYPAI